ncbi:holin family protein [Sansalvadorimonas sp. 2012CJ34-2]|uniref:Holin family protein n=1 Tax=Parendozoicomonas callyspongiae TaxID=2942213 RepID=A0ABT0PFY4_9GAMM|nr:3TM-type holin [Sansalvadorimonas sp. 2012CJ34-2]MCL6270270.1 holin family protein [Sansalvadorimonas sp. 2012CJ34-2]
MSLLSAIPLVGKVIDKIFPDKNKSIEAKAALTEMIVNGELDELAEQAGVIKAEAQGESWLQRNWRPLVMVTFTALIVCRWMGWASPDLSEALEMKLLGIVQLGIGGYIASRGVEKAVRSWPVR